MIHILFQKLAYNPNSKPKIREHLSPLPQKMEIGGGAIILDENTQIIVEGNELSLENFPKFIPNVDVDFLVEPKWTLEQFSDHIREWLNLRISELPHTFRFIKSQFKVNSTDWASELPLSEIPVDNQRQAYYLKISSQRIEIIAWTMHGAYYGLTTILQAMYLEHKIQIVSLACPAITVWDWPQYQTRGLIDDISRGQRPTVENFKEFIRFLSRNKQNVLTLSMEDIIYFKSHPKIGEGRGVLMPEDVKEIQAYAKEWFVTIIPALQVFGHLDNMLTIPEFLPYAEFPGAQCFDISNPKTKDLIREMLSDILPLFECNVFSPMCDESFDFGHGKSKEYVKKRGFGKALGEVYLFLIQEIKKLGKPIVLFAHDIIYKYPEAMKVAQKENALIFYWHYADKKKYWRISKLKKRGFNVAGGPAVFDWSRHFPYFDFAEKNTIYMGKDGVNRGVNGLITTKFGDFFNENFRNNIFYGLAVNGQASWSPFQSKVSQIRTAFNWNFYASEDPRVIECIDLLSKQNTVLPSFPNGIFNRFWMDPFIRKIAKKEYRMARRFMEEHEHIMRNLEKIRSQETVKINRDNLDYIEFAAQLSRHYAVKILVSEASYWERPEIMDPVVAHLNLSQQNPILEGFQWLKKDIENLLPKYQALWLRLALIQGLEYPSRRFEILGWYYDQAIQALQNHQKPHANQLQAEWIWRAGKRTSATWGNQQWLHFLKIVKIQKPLQKARIQGIAANHLKIAINGDYVGEVLSRFSLSQYPMAKAVELFDVTSLLHDGDNMLCVEGINWAAGVGGINIALHIEYQDGTTEDVYSDKSWGYLIKRSNNWPYKTIESIDNKMWQPVRSFGKPPGAWQGPINTPIWEKGWKSGVSFVFGNRNFVEIAMNVFVGEKLTRLVFWAIPIVMRFMHVDNVGYRKIP